MSASASRLIELTIIAATVASTIAVTKPTIGSGSVPIDSPYMNAVATHAAVRQGRNHASHVSTG
jgi:hypothetical protein